MEPVRLSQLEAYAIDPIEELRRRRLFAESMKNPPLMRRQGVGRARGKAPQQRRIVRLGAGDATLALRGRGRRIESQDLIDEAQVPVVVEQTLVRGDLGIDTNPKAHVPLELGRMSERIARLGGARARLGERRQHRA